MIDLLESTTALIFQKKKAFREVETNKSDKKTTNHEDQTIYEEKIQTINKTPLIQIMGEKHRSPENTHSKVQNMIDLIESTTALIFQKKKAFREFETN